jgi:hypothetical protein
MRELRALNWQRSQRSEMLRLLSVDPPPAPGDQI